jgi:hypothetical protein
MEKLMERKPGRDWTLKEVRFIKQNLHLTDKELGEILGRSAKSVKGVRFRNGLIRPKDQWNWRAGNKPWNKGIKYNAGGRSIETRFKKGQPSPNARRMYEVFTMADGNGETRMFIKLPHNRAYRYSWYVYEKHTGEKVGKGELIRFKDGNNKNFSPENLIKVTRAENVRMNANRKKQGEGLKKTWAVVKTFEDFGLTPPYKFRSKKKRA